MSDFGQLPVCLSLTTVRSYRRYDTVLHSNLGLVLDWNTSLVAGFLSNTKACPPSLPGEEGGGSPGLWWWSLPGAAAPLPVFPITCLHLSRQQSKRKWTGVATWRWVANDDNCGICRMPFDGCCPDCKVPGDDCPLVWGQCSHCFHIHCIMKWLNSQQVHHQCPMCRQEWKFKE
uniref:Anaphase-promoting complex subunit 11 n=2 Tax=Timema TaxID=61471 RepID=A0A7R9IF31_9NEOP|nr:unnamed protein product [Timema bartmani]CAD7457052.1 unnamed protein product [Timema tahoe]